jgi:hypothetical protein
MLKMNNNTFTYLLTKTKGNNAVSVIGVIRVND